MAITSDYTHNPVMSVMAMLRQLQCTPSLRYETQQDTSQSVLPCVCHHPCAQTLPPQSQQAEHAPKEHDDHHMPRTLVSRCKAKNNRRKDQAYINVAGDRAELALQVIDAVRRSVILNVG